MILVIFTTLVEPFIVPLPQAKKGPTNDILDHDCDREQSSLLVGTIYSR